MSTLIMHRTDLNNLPAMPAPPHDYRLRLLLPEEAAALAALMKLAFPEWADGWNVARVERELVSDPNVTRTFVVETNGEIVATASALLEPEANPGVGVVHWVAAHPAHRGKALGYLASLAVLHEFVRLGCRSAMLRTDGYRLPAIKTYQNLGFLPVDAPLLPPF